MNEEFPVQYTSIKEILMAEDYHRKRIEEEVMMIENSLVRQAALGYFSPMPQPPNSKGYVHWIKKLFPRRFRSRCIREEEEEKKDDDNDKIGCIQFIFGVCY
ncbi:unnamed protein product [Amaranthus hypochondriacus]